MTYIQRSSCRLVSVVSLVGLYIILLQLATPATALGASAPRIGECVIYTGQRVECTGRLLCKPSVSTSERDSSADDADTVHNQVCPRREDTANGTWSATQGVIPPQYQEEAVGEKIATCDFLTNGYFTCWDSAGAFWEGKFTGSLNSAFQLGLAVPVQQAETEIISEPGQAGNGEIEISEPPSFTITPHPVFVCEYYNNGRVGCRNCTEKVLRTPGFLHIVKPGTRHNYICSQPKGGPVLKAWRADNGIVPLVPDPSVATAEVVATCIFEKGPQIYECHGVSDVCDGTVPGVTGASKCLAGSRWNGTFTGDFSYL